MNAGARGIRNGESVRQILFTVKERMEWYVVQQTVRNDDKVLRLKLAFERRQQLGVEFFQVRIRRREQCVLKLSKVFGIEAKFRQLKLEQAQQFCDACFNGGGSY